MATHSGILAGKIPWTEAPGEIQSMGCKELDMTEHTHKPLGKCMLKLSLKLLQFCGSGDTVLGKIPGVLTCFE